MTVRSVRARSARFLSYPSNTSSITPNILEHTKFSNITLEHNRYGTRIVWLRSTLWERVFSVATPVVIARDSASPALTTASGSSLTQSMAGVVHEVQSVETSGSGSFAMSSSDGLSTTQSLDIETTTSSQLESALNSILGTSSVHVTRHEASDTTPRVISTTSPLWDLRNQDLLLGSATGT